MCTYKILFVALLSVNGCRAQKIPQVTIIKHFFKNPNSIPTLVKTVDQIEENELDYPDYDGRRGSIWTDAWIENPDSRPSILTECKDTAKGSQSTKKFEQRNPESIFSYPDVHKIFSEEILPKTLNAIKKNGWVDKLPPKIFAQLFVQRCHIGNRMDWHQDPGEDYQNMADYSLVLMLGNPHDPCYGWKGGEFHIRPGLPHEETEGEQTIVHEENQGILFNNKLQSHSVSEVASDKLQSKRDLIVVALYFDKPPIPLHADDKNLKMHQMAVNVF